MKLKITLLILICFTKIYSQKIEKEVGEIKITKDVYYFNYYLKSEKRKTAKNEFYFDNLGKILEKITFGTQHYSKLNEIGMIEQYTYQNENLIFKKRWISSCESCNFTAYDTEYIYDQQNRLIKQIFSNPISEPFIYKYEKDTIEIHSGNYYIQKIYDKQKRVTQHNQIFEKTNKIRWQYLYEYQNKCRIANFQTYYGDGKENSKKEIVNYNSENQIISKEIFNYFKTKIVYKYSKNGLIKKIKEYQNSAQNEDYKLLRLTKFKINRKPKNLNSEVIGLVNSELIDE